MKTYRLATLALLAALAHCACAQHAPNYIDSDSLSLVDAAWQVDSIGGGMTLKRHHFLGKTYMASNQYIAYVEIPAQEARRLAFVQRDTLTATSLQAQAAHAIVAVNGSYFDMDRGNPICYLRIGGREVGENTAGQDTAHRKYYQYASLALDSNDLLHFWVPDSGRRAEKQWDAPNIMTAGPMLISHNQAVPQRQDRTFVTQRHNRTALGRRADGTVILLAVDGRTKQSAGMTLPELATTLHYLGCVQAINLDGGGSTTLWTRQHGIVNHPSDNGRFDRNGERPVSNCIILR